MELTDRVLTGFHDHVTAVNECAEALSTSAAEGAALILTALLNDQKILVCGNGASAALGQLFASHLLNRFERERPGLPALPLTADAITVTAIASQTHYNEVFAKQIRALGQPGDVLVILTVTGNSPNILSAADAAHERGMKIIACTGMDGGGVASLLEDADIHLCVPSESSARVREIHLLALHTLCELVDHQLLGG